MDIGCTVERSGNLPSLNQWVDSCPELLRDSANLSLLGSLNYVLSRSATSRALGSPETHNLLSLTDSLDESNHDLVKEIFNYFFWTWKHASGDFASNFAQLERISERIKDPSVKAYCVGVLQAMGKS